MPVEDRFYAKHAWCASVYKDKGVGVCFELGVQAH